MRRLLIITLTALFIIWLIKPETAKDLVRKTGKVLSERISQSKRETEVVVKNKSTQAAKEVNNTIQDRILQTANNVNQYLEKQTEQVLGINIGKDKPEVSVVNDVPKKQSDSQVLIDYLTNKGITLDLEMNKTYYLDIRNLPEDTCLFVDNQVYPFKNSEYLSITFSQSGEYNLYFDYCDKSLTKFGNIIVK